MPGPKSYPSYYAPHRSLFVALPQITTAKTPSSESEPPKTTMEEATEEVKEENEEVEEKKAPTLLTLPLEIRRQIFTELLPSEMTITTDPPVGEPHNDTTAHSSADSPTGFCALLQTCSQIHNEATDVLYSLPIIHSGCGEFTNERHTVIQTWLSDIGAVNRSRVRKIALNYDNIVNRLLHPGSGLLGLMITYQWHTTNMEVPADMLQRFDELARMMAEQAVEKTCAEIARVARKCKGLVEVKIWLPGNDMVRRVHGSGVKSPRGWFDRGFFRNEGVREAIAGLRGVGFLQIGITCNLDAVDDIGRQMGVRRAEVWWDFVEWDSFTKIVFSEEKSAVEREDMWMVQVERWNAAGWVFGRSGSKFYAVKSFMADNRLGVSGA